MWQQAVVTCAFLLFETTDHLTQSADFNAKEPSVNGRMKKVGAKSSESDSRHLSTANTYINHTSTQKQQDTNDLIVLEGDKTFSNLTKGNKEFLNHTESDESSNNFTSIRNTTLKIMDSSVTPMGIILILMGVTTILAITMAYTLAIYTTEKRLFTERQIAMQIASTNK